MGSLAFTARRLAPPSSKMASSIGFRMFSCWDRDQRANFRWEVTSLALSIARWVRSSTIAAFPEAPL
jgi:hypothetical protein